MVVVPPNTNLLTSLRRHQRSFASFVLREEGSVLNVIMEYLFCAPADALQVVMELGSPESIKGAVEFRLGIFVDHYAR